MLKQNESHVARCYYYRVRSIEQNAQSRPHPVPLLAHAASVVVLNGSIPPIVYPVVVIAAIARLLLFLFAAPPPACPPLMPLNPSRGTVLPIYAIFLQIQLAKYYSMQESTPARASLMTGRYPVRYGMQHGVLQAGAPWGLPTKEKVRQSPLV